jgi:hypothetical protein
LVIEAQPRLFDDPGVKQIEKSVARYMSQLDTADRRTAAGEDPSEAALLTKTRLKEKLAKLDEEVKRLAAIEKALLASPVTCSEVGVWRDILNVSIGLIKKASRLACSCRARQKLMLAPSRSGAYLGDTLWPGRM